MADCCQHSFTSEKTGRFFSKHSRRYARLFRKGKLEKIQKYLLEGIHKERIEGKTILDIGSGVGSLHLTLLQEGAEHATGVDMSEEMLKHARTFSQKLSMEQKTFYINGDFVEHADSITNADITILDKVICCYEDYERLIQSSADKTSLLYAVSIPSNTFLMKFIFKTEISIAKLFRAGFHPYWHNWNAVQEFITTQGFSLIYSNSTIAWKALVFKRAAK